MLCEEPRAIAGRFFRAERRSSTLQPTVLVHEAYVRLMSQTNEDPMNLSRGDLHHLTHAAHGGRQILFAVDEARAIHYAIQRPTPTTVTTGYELSNAVVDALRRNKPDGLDVQDKLDSMIGKPFGDEASLIAEFELRLGNATVTKHKAVLVASARQERSDHWFEWQVLQLPKEKEDPSVVARER